MLEQLHLVHFQRWQKLTVEFEQVTTFIGPSDCGKTAVLRALLWVATNNPSGTEFIHHGKTEANATLHADGRIIQRVRGKDNTYVLDGEMFRAFGADVPPAIRDLLNLGPVNYQAQLDPPFWFLESAGQVSRELNAIINLGVIDNVLAEAASRTRKARATVEVSTDRLLQARQQRDQLHFVQQMDADLQVIEGLEAYLSKIQQRHSTLGRTLETASTLQQQRDRALQGGKRAILLGSNLEELLAVQERARNLRELISCTVNAQRASMRVIPDLGPLEVTAGKLEHIQNVRGRLTELVWQIEQEQQRWQARKKQAARAEKVLVGALGKQCPLCSQPIP